MEQRESKIILSSSLRWRFQKVADRVVSVTDYFAVNFIILDDETTELMDFIGTNLITLNNIPVGEMVRDMRDCIGLCKEHIELVVDILNNRRFNKMVKVKK